MKLAIGSDHGGYALKVVILPLLQELGHEVEDVGCYDDSSVDYPTFADAVCESVTSGVAERGILICGTGIGMSMAANKKDGIRAALCSDYYTAVMSREHNDANVLCLGERVTGPGVAAQIVEVWLATSFAAGRHLRRVELFS